MPKTTVLRGNAEPLDLNNPLVVATKAKLDKLIADCEWLAEYQHQLKQAIRQAKEARND